MSDKIKSIEDELLALRDNAKKEIAKIVDMSGFTQSIYGLMLSTLIEIEKANNEIYYNNPGNPLEHSSLEFLFANPNEDCYIFNLVKLNAIENIPSKLYLKDIENSFTAKFYEIIKEYNSNQKTQDFLLQGIEISTFYNNINVLLKKNTTLICNFEESANKPITITISLNLGE